MIKIIMIDDEISALNNFLAQIVDHKEIECKFFKDEPESAVEYVKNNAVAAALVDIRLNGTDGITLAKRLIAVSPATKIIFITGYEQNEEKIRVLFSDNTLLGFVYKPYEPAQLNALLATIAPPSDIFLHTFGRFDLFIDGRAIYFPSAKSKELLAILTDARGAFVSMEKAIDWLWQDKNAESGKHLWRDAVYRLRKTLRDEGVEKLVRFERGCACIQTEYARCDLWDFFDGKTACPNRYMEQYDWAELTTALLERFNKD